MTILLIRPGALGDTLLTIPLVHSLRKHHPELALTWLGTRRYRDVVPSDITFAEMDSPAWTWLFETEASAPINAPFFEHGYLALNRWEQVEARLRRVGTSRVLGVTSAPPPGVHLVEHLHRGLGLPIPGRFPVCEHLRPLERQDLVWLHPGSGGARKCVPLRVFQELVRAIGADRTWPVVVTRGEEDAFLLRDPDWELLVSDPRVRVVEGISLKSLCTQIGGARIYIGNDSGISHLAANLGIPSVVFFRSTAPRQWAPWVPDGQCTAVEVREEGHEVGGIVDRCRELVNIMISRNLVAR
jgi:heptosyltransferase III